MSALGSPTSRTCTCTPSQREHKIPLVQISSIKNSMATDRVIRLDHFRTMSVYAFPAPGHLPSEVIDRRRAEAERAGEDTCRRAIGCRIGGEYDKQKVGFRNLAVVLSISVSAIYLALLFQFNNAIKPFLVFAAAPYGVAGALIALWVMNTSVWIHGVPGNRQPDRRDCQPRDCAV